MKPRKLEILEAVCKLVADACHTTVEDMKSESRKRHHADARRIFWAIMVRRPDVYFTLDELGAFLGRDHASVIHCVKTVPDLCEFNVPFRDKYNRAAGNITERGPIELVLSADHYNNIPQL